MNKKHISTISTLFQKNNGISHCIKLYPLFHIDAVLHGLWSSGEMEVFAKMRCMDNASKQFLLQRLTCVFRCLQELLQHRKPRFLNEFGQPCCQRADTTHGFHVFLNAFQQFTSVKHDSVASDLGLPHSFTYQAIAKMKQNSCAK